MENVNGKEKSKKLATLLINDFFISNPQYIKIINDVLVNNGVNVSSDIKKIMLKHFICIDMEDQIIDFMFYGGSCLNFRTTIENLFDEEQERYTYNRLRDTNYLHFISNADFDLIERAFFKDVAA